MKPCIHHVQIAIPPGGEKLARHFYGDLLGLEEIEKPDNLRARGGVWFVSDNLQLHLGIEGEFRPARKAHVAFEVADLSALRKCLAAAGYTASEDEPLPGYGRFYVADPFGNRVEILAPHR